MKPAKRTLAIVALTTTLMSCSSQAVPATMPTAPVETLRIYATTATLPLVMDLTTAYSDTPPVSFDTRNSNYQTILNDLLSGETPYFITNHLPLESTLWAAPIGQDGIAIITHPQTPVQNLTLEQLRDIYQGRITRWDQAGNLPHPQEITLFTRENGSGTRLEFEQMVMGRRITTANARVAFSSQNMIENIAQTPNSIGYVSISYLEARVQAIPINDSLPTQQNIRDNIYPLRSTLYITGLQPPEGRYLTFFGWVQSLQGQAIVARRYVAN